MFLSVLLGLDEEYFNNIEKEEISLYNDMDNCNDLIYRKNIIRELIKITNARIIRQHDLCFNHALRMSIVMTENEYGKNNSYKDLLTQSIDYEINLLENECIAFGLVVYADTLVKSLDRFLALVKTFNRQNDEVYMKYIEGIDTDTIYDNRMEFHKKFIENIVFDEDDYLNDFDEFFQSLSDIDQTILNEKFGLNGGECQSMKDVAIKLNVTREEIRHAVIRFKRKYMKKYH